MEKKKLLIISVSVGLFLIVVIGASILVFSPRNYPDITKIDDLSIPPGRLDTKRIESYAPPVTPATQGLQDNSQNTVDGTMQQQMNQVQKAENRIYIRGEDPDSLVRVERLNDGITETFITIPTPKVQVNGSSATSATSGEKIEIQVEKPVSKSQSNVEQKKVVQDAPVKTTRTEPKKQASPVKKSSSSDPVYWVQTGSFAKKSSADAAKKYLDSKLIPTVITDGEVKGKTYFRVRMGPYTTSKEAEHWLNLVKSVNGMEASMIWLDNI
ncbi:MAG: SPOR domain-containing protein [Termitinemataceae bacterium]|nr:MAG: SPOR domain-containing protein [Termitinemataceae bacterium]